MQNANCKLQIEDGAFDAELVRAAAREWPAEDWPHWVRYNTWLERKQACHQWEHLPPACARLLGQMAAILQFAFCNLQSPLLPDLSLHGAGLHSMRRLGRLAKHLDSDGHPRLGLHRAANAILFLDQWEPEWGGEFVLHTGQPPLVVSPAAGRLLLFTSTDDSQHEVRMLHCPSHVVRKSLALYFYAAEPAAGRRPRAQFLGAGGEELSRAG